MEWIVALGIVVVAAFVLPWSIAASKRSRRGKAMSGGIGGALLEVYDPARARAVETIEKQQEVGEAPRGADGAP